MRTFTEIMEEIKNNLESTELNIEGRWAVARGLMITMVMIGLGVLGFIIYFS